ncbi:type VI secretion system contractile sheath large subunit [Stieleria sp. TO1_6]|uniref:type VI secretion system contractile sheath large subunit n=1 Tax=Stieleria tagensis TaxID=2956795 RepID=UPI00209AAC91|nr:type VI secretion system contractile sheath large subunit [Stieleria tagensis]MCO8121096.1 type VI secretion system contractile sheath large subunit [Stieleria tagensis]
MSRAEFQSNDASPTAAPLADALLQRVLEADPTTSIESSTSAGTTGRPTASLSAFLSATTVADSLGHWLGAEWRDDDRLSEKESLLARLAMDIAEIDRLLCDQVNAILHHPKFQRLESSWRGLAFLVHRADLESDPMIRVRVLSARWKELEKDFERSVEFDQSSVFKKVYEEEFGSPGGEPFGVLVGDYDVHPRVSAERPTDDLSVLRSLAGVAASSFCPILLAASPELLDLESFAELQITRDHAARLSRPDYLKWNALRDDEDSRFLAMVLPRILMRGPYEDDGSRIDRFVFQEDVSRPDGNAYLWGNPGYAYAAVLMRSFADSGWLADVRGLRQDVDGGGLVSDLPALSFPTDARGVIPRPITEVTVTDSLERQLSDLGLLPLCDCKDTPMAVFASGQSLQRPKTYDTADANTNAKISAMLPYMLTVSRFAHYVKVIARTKTGSFSTADDLQRILYDWIIDYVTADREASADVKSRKPLREANITVQPDPGNPGSFFCVMRLAPHYELDEMVGSVRLQTRIGRT